MANPATHPQQRPRARCKYQRRIRPRHGGRPNWRWAGSTGWAPARKPVIGSVQLVSEDGQLVAVLVWCAAAWHLKARDETVG